MILDMLSVQVRDNTQKMHTWANQHTKGSSTGINIEHVLGVISPATTKETPRAGWS